MLESVIKTIEKYDMLGNDTEITVALSGGADSVALLLCLLELQGKLNVKISAAHLNHCLRGAEACRDEQFVKELCESYAVPLFCERADIRAEVQQTHESLELCARRVRYDFLNRVSKGLIATAHTANDNIETVIHNMVRGTGIAGMCGIPPKRGRIIRPLINVTRFEVEKFCAERNVSFCTDSTNNDEAYTRNRIRHSVVPVLNEINKNAIINVSQMSVLLRDDAELLNQLAEDALTKLSCEFGLKADELLDLHPALRSRCIARFYEQSVNKAPENKHITAITELLSVGGKASVQNGWLAEVKDGFLKLSPPKAEFVFEKSEVKELPFQYNGLKISFESAENIKYNDKFNNLFLNNLIDCDKICGKLILRVRNNGDSIKLKNRPTKSFKKLFNENRVDQNRRDCLLVLADDNGVVWLQGFGVAERCALTPETKKVLTVEGDNEAVKGYNRVGNMNLDSCIEAVLFDGKTIAEAVRGLGAKISKDYKDKKLLLVSVLKGSVVFMADLMRSISIPCTVDFMEASSYRAGAVGGDIEIVKDLKTDITGYDVLLVEDILDTGVTLLTLKRLLEKRNPASVKICAIFDKPERRKVDIKADYCGLTVPDEFIVGYGLDYDEKFRNLPYVGVLKRECYE